MILVSEALSQPEQNTNFTYKASPEFYRATKPPKTATNLYDAQSRTQH